MAPAADLTLTTFSLVSVDDLDAATAALVRLATPYYVDRWPEAAEVSVATSGRLDAQTLSRAGFRVRTVRQVQL